MANHFSALKRARQTKKRTERNRSARARLRHTIRDLRTSIGKDPAAAKTEMPATVSLIDKAVKKGLIKENTASRFKSRLAIRLTQASAQKS